MLRIRNWLQTCPQMGQVQLDQTPQLGGCGLYPRGVEELWRRQDVAGNTHTRCRERYYLETIRQDALETNAQWLQRLSRWVREQSIAGKGPALGEQQQMSFTAGKAERAPSPGLSRYSGELTVEYTL